MNIKRTTKSDVCYSSRTYLHPSRYIETYFIKFCFRLKNPKHVEPKRGFSFPASRLVFIITSTARLKNEQIYSANKG